MILEQITAPGLLPLTLQQIKTHLRLETSDDDAYLDMLRNLVTDCLDGPNGMLGGRCIVQQVWELRLSNWAHRHFAFSDRDNEWRGYWPMAPIDYRIEIPLPPFINIISVKHLDMAEVVQTLAADQYVAISKGWEPAVLQPAFGVTWPLIAYWRPDAVRIRFTAGYAEVSGVGLVGKIPFDIQMCMLKAIGNAWENRDQSVDIYIDQMMLSPSRLPVVA